jgi:hypothetical protein
MTRFGQKTTLQARQSLRFADRYELGVRVQWEDMIIGDGDFLCFRRTRGCHDHDLKSSAIFGREDGNGRLTLGIEEGNGRHRVRLDFVAL